LAPPAPTPCAWQPWTSNPWLGSTIRVAAHRRIAFPRLLSWLRDGSRVLGSVDQQQCRPTNNTPVGAVKQFLISFATQDTAALARLLSADYRFSSTNPGFVDRFPGGLDRAGQVDSVARLAAAPTLSVLAMFPDTLIPQSPPPEGRASQTIVLQALHLRAVICGSELVLADSSACSFLLVRGDSARVPPGEPADAGYWYVVRWHSGAGPVPGEGRVDSLARAASPMTAEASPLPFRVRRESALNEWPVTFELSLPDRIDVRLEVFDPGGRRVLSRTLANTTPAVRRFQLEEGGFAAGLYWLRVSHGPHRLVAKFIVLR